MTDSTKQTNGAAKIQWYIITALTAVVLSLAGAWAADTSKRVVEAERRLSVLETTIAQSMAKIDVKLEFIQENLKEHVKETHKK